MSRRSLVLVLAALALPATAQTFESSGRLSAAACISVANASYRIAAPGERADYTVRLDPAAATPDVRIRFDPSIDAADFVLVSDEGAASRCRDGAVIRTIRIDPAAETPDLTIGFTSDASEADYRIYLQGGAVAPEAAAALYAVAQLSGHHAAPTDQMVTSGLTTRKP